MLVIRFQRIGRKNDPHFRAVVTDSKNAPQSGKFLEIVGSYNPKLGTTAFNAERIAYWISQGTQPSANLHNFLVKKEIIKGEMKNVTNVKTNSKKKK